MIPIAKPIIEDEERKAVLSVLSSGSLSQGKKVAEFEAAFAKYCGVKYAIATSSGTAALHLALLAHDIGPGDEVITSPFTFIASVNSILYLGAKPVLVDIDYDSFNINPSIIKKAVTKRTKAILPIHLFGNPCEMRTISKIAQEYQLAIIEDACQAHGAEVEGKKVGSFGTGCFSFYPTKNMTTGEGGMVTTNDSKIAEKISILRNHGMKKRYYYESIGYNFRMTEIEAALGIVQLSKLDRFNEARIKNANYLISTLKDLVDCPQVSKGVKHVFHQFTVKIKHDRDKVQKKLSSMGIESMIYYPVPVYRQKAYLGYGYRPFDYSKTERASRQVLSLPVHPRLSRQDLTKIESYVKSAVRDTS